MPGRKIYPMEISACGIPNIRVRKYGPKRDPLEIVEAATTLPAWDGYLVERFDDGRTIADGTVLVHFACNERSTDEDWQTQISAYNDVLKYQHEIRDNILRAVIANIDH